MKKKILLKTTILIVLLGTTVALGLNKITTENQQSEVKEGVLSTLTSEESKEKIERLVEEGKFNVAIAEEIYIDVETLKGKADIQNIPNNPCDLQVDIISTETGEVFYSSEVLTANSYIEYITIIKSLALGEYQCEAHVKALDTKSGEELGSTTISIKLNVIKEI